MNSSNYLRYLWTSIWLSFGTLLGIVFVVLFAIQDNLNAGMLLLWAFAFLVIGGLLGFIFSVPKIITDTPPPPPAIPPPGPSGPAPDPVGHGANAPTTGNLKLTPIGKAKAQENTNLTQISDWLTKILIGAGLVQLREVPGFVHHIAIVMGSGISTSNGGTTGNAGTIMSAAIILYFITWGFICGYLVMKLVLTDQFVKASNREDVGEQ